MSVFTNVETDESQDFCPGERLFFLAGATCLVLCLAALAAWWFSGAETHHIQYVSLLRLG